MRINQLKTVFQRLYRSRRARRLTAIILAAVLILNVAVYVAYRGRTYPNTAVTGHHIGSVSSDSLQGKLRSLPILPKTVTIADKGKKTEIAISDTGVAADYDGIVRQALDQRSWLPVANFFTTHTVPVNLQVDNGKLRSALTKSLAQFESQPANAKIERRGDSFAIKPESAGQSVEIEATAKRLANALRQGDSSIAPVTKRLDAAVTAASLQARLSELKDQSQTAVSVHFEGQSKRFSAAEVAGWYAGETEDLVLSDGAIQSSIVQAGAGFGIRVQNLAEATAAIKKTVQDRKDLDVSLIAAPKARKTLTYCTAVRGVDDSELAGLAAKLQETFADQRGWGLGGQVEYVHRDAGCDFTVWLSAADQMPTFGAICDAEWSCAVSPNVVINFDRWRFASAAWNQNGGSLSDYRAMVINHEVGHWHGFYHSYCPGAGQQAPVMQQQSINLQGCSFNPWPTQGERDALAGRLGL
jgi:hypothetical protein